MHLYLIRHAQSANNDLYTRTGGSAGRHADPPLTELGHRQAQLLANFLAYAPPERGQDDPPVGEYDARHNRRGFALTHLYCSLMTRAIQTGGYIAEATGLPLVGWPEIHERGGLHHIDEATGEDVGIPGPGRAWFAAEYPSLALPDALGEEGWWNRPQETNAEAVTRARVVWAQLLERHSNTDDSVAMVIHGGFFQSLMTVLLSTGRETEFLPRNSVSKWDKEIGFGMSNVSVSRFEIGNDLVIIRYDNQPANIDDKCQLFQCQLPLPKRIYLPIFWIVERLVLAVWIIR
jgi:2,3-bisphosphoglycerate-dependent phosphoglycerate mutase